MNIDKAKKIALKEMSYYSIILNSWNFKFDSAKTRFGLCNFKTKTISLSKVLVELNNEKEVKDTILHEIAHALVGVDNNHNKIWKETAKSIGCSGERLYSNKVIEPKPVLIRYCETCGKESKYYKKNYGKKISCGHCSKTYNKKYLLKIKK